MMLLIFTFRCFQTPTLSFRCGCQRCVVSGLRTCNHVTSPSLFSTQHSWGRLSDARCVFRISAAHVSEDIPFDFRRSLCATCGCVLFGDTDTRDVSRANVTTHAERHGQYSIEMMVARRARTGLALLREKSHTFLFTIEMFISALVVLLFTSSMTFVRFWTRARCTEGPLAGSSHARPLRSVSAQSF